MTPIFYLVVAAYGSGDALDLSGQTPNVEDSFSAGVVADREDALDVGEAGQILQVLGDLEELNRGACARHRPAVILDRGLVHRAWFRRGAGIDVGKQDRIAHVRMVLLYALRVMHTALADRAYDLHLGGHRVDRQHAALDREFREQVGRRVGHFRLLSGCAYAQHDSHANRVSRKIMSFQHSVALQI